MNIYARDCIACMDQGTFVFQILGDIVFNMIDEPYSLKGNVYNCLLINIMTIGIIYL